MTGTRPVAIGCMRLSTAPDRDAATAIAVLHAAFDAGVTLLDTAGAYCRDDGETGHNERLVALALSTWHGDRSRIRVATKGGMTRPDGRWETDGRAKHLIAACERSRRALGVERIDLYQLHAPDPRTPLATSVRALAALKRDGAIEAIGLCNVTVGQIEEARRITEIDAIQVELSIWQDANILSGVAEYCVRNGLTLLAHRPLGGRKSAPRTQADPVLNGVAARHGATPFQIALAWLADLSTAIVPLPGVTRVETAQSAAHSRLLELTEEDRRALDDRFPSGRVLRAERARPSARSLRQDAEVVLVMGLPGAGKTTLTEGFIAAGYERLNRDEAGGRLRDLLRTLDRALASGVTHVVLDNTYISRKSRAEVVRAAAQRGVAVRCVWLSTSVDDAQVNAAWRLVSRYGRLPGEEELAALQKQDVAAFPPMVQFRYQRELEPPDASEGFSRIDVMPFERRIDPAHVHRAVIVWWDDVCVTEDRAAILRRYHAEGWRVLGMSWQPGIAGGTRTVADVTADFARLNERLGFAMDVVYCPHGAGPPRCWCRKPLPGLGVLLIHRHQLDPAHCIYVGDAPQDPGFARKLGFTYREAGAFFAPSV
jgi:aryl-alcohol dehydrogenase-like predicted oxidoreductase/predicted kinase